MPDFARMLDELQYTLIVMLAGVHWSLQKALLTGGYTIKLINQWLIDNAFVPIISQTNDSLRVAVGWVFVVALLVLGITYLLAAFVRLEVVSPRSAILWYVAGLLFFAVGPSLYQGMNTFRLNISQVMYLSVLDSLETTTSGTFSSLSLIDSDDLTLGPLCDGFDVYLPGATGAGPIDGLDVALAYLRGHAQDVMGYPQPVYSPGCGVYLLNPNPSTWTSGGAGGSVVPMDWNMEGGYFDHNVSPITWDDITEVERDAAVAMAGASQRRALTAWPLILFGLAEQIVGLLITIAMGITFISFGVAILFAFFKRTESIAQNMINQWIELIVQTVAIALVQALIMGFFLAGAAAGSAPAVIGISLICLVFILITLWSGVKAVWNSFNRLFNAMGQVAGGTIMSPGTATVVAAGGAAAVAAGGAALASGAVTVGSNAMAGASALNQGATMAQAAGLTLGGSQTLTGVARTLTHLPGLHGTPLYDVAEQFSEGAAARRVVHPMVGRMLLTDRDPDKAQRDEDGRVISRPMLVPAVGDMLKDWSLPGEKRKRGDTVSAPQSVNWLEGEDGELYPQFTPVRARRMGMFTPVTPAEETGGEDSRRQREKSDYAAEMNSEEMEQHVSDVMRSSTGVHSTLGGMLEREGQSGTTRLDAAVGRLEVAAETLANAARLGMMVGQLRVTGGQDVAGVLGDAVRGIGTDRQRNGETAAAGADHLTTANAMARAMGVMPLANGQPAIVDNLARFGLFTDQALRMGLTGEQTETVIREVKASPEGRLSDETRNGLVEQVRGERNLSWEGARDEVNRLEHYTRALPEEVTAFGMVAVPSGMAPQPMVQVEPEIHVEPEVTVAPEITVTAADDPAAQPYDEAVKRESAMGGSGSVLL